jgi:PqqD family protein of HPr-rel-A system
LTDLAGPDARFVRWRAATEQALDWAHWDSEYVLYHRPSGLTHLVNDVTATLLREVLTTPCSVDAAAIELAAREGAEIGAEYVEDLLNLVERLEALGLVERCNG